VPCASDLMVPSPVVRSVWSGNVGDTDDMRLTFSKQGDYAIRAMLALAGAEPDAWLSVARISAAMAIPERILPRVMRDLGAASLVTARTGRTGGYRLARPAGSITLLAVIAAADPEDDARRCVLRGIPCGLDGRCAVHDVFDEAREALYDRLARTTLAELVPGPS
jgi:Rrf2 family iron-sulfur cluster assembly transcriptional regulator